MHFGVEFAFATSIRLIYAVIGWLLDLFNSRKESKEKALKDSLLIEQKAQNILQSQQKMISNFQELDVFQLYIIQELKRQNHKSVNKGAPLYTLKQMDIVYTPAVGPKTESASLTNASKKLLNDKFWEEFDDLKYNAANRFFTGLQPEDIKCFIAFLENDKIKTTFYRSGKTTYTDSYYVFKKYSDTTLFSQPQSGSEYTIDPIAKNVLSNIYNDVEEAQMANTYEPPGCQ